jgi:HYDIN/CFA65/VesB-like, Ig-like domain
MSLRLANLRRRLALACVWSGSALGWATLAGCIGSGDDNAFPSAVSDAGDARAGDNTTDAPAEVGHEGGDATLAEGGGQDAGDAASKNTPVLSLSDTKVDVGSVECGSMPVTKTLTITNTGGSPLSVSASKAGTAFSLNPTALTLPPGMSGALTVTANVPSSATAGVPVAGSLALFTNDPSNTNVVLPLAAMPTGATLTGISTFTFASTEVGTPAPQVSVQLKNTGNGAATFTFSAPSDPSVTFVNPPPGGGITLNAGDVFTSPVAFTPANATKSVSTTSAIATTHGIVCGASVASLTFTGRAATGTLQGWPSSNQVDFGPANCGGAPPPSQTITLSNTAATDVRVSVDPSSQLNGFRAMMGPKVPGGGSMTITLSAPSAPASTPGNAVALTPVRGTLVLATDGVPTMLTANLTEEPQGAILGFGNSTTPGCTTSANLGTFTGGILLQAVAPESFCVVNTGNAPASVRLLAAETGGVDAGVFADAGGDATADASGGVAVPPPFTTLVPAFTIPATANASTPSVEQESLTFQPVHANATIGSLVMAVDSTTALCAVLPTPLPLSGSAIGGGPDVEPTALAFGATCGGDPPGAQTFIVRNLGTVNMTWAMSRPTGPGAALYTVTPSQPPGLLNPGQSTTVTVTAPKVPSPAPSTDPAALTAQLTITTDVPLDPPHVVTLSEVPLGDQLSASAGSLRFGQVPVGIGVSQNFTITNNANPGSSAQSASVSLTVSGTGAAAFSAPQAISGDLSAGHSSDYSLGFSPSSAAPFPATLVLSTTDPLCSPLPAPIVLSGTGTSGLVSVSASTLAFGATGDANGFVNCGSVGQSQTVTVANVGNQSFNVTGVALGKGNLSPFTLALVNSPVTLAIGGSTTITINPSIIPKVGVDPNNKTAFSDSLTITTDASGDAPHTIPLVMQARGTVISSSTLPPTTWNFGTVAAGSIGTFSGTTIQNTGNLSAMVTLQPTQTMSLPTVFGLQNNPVAVPPGITSLIGQFTPDLADGTWTGLGQLVVSSAAFCDNVPTPWLTPVISFTGSSSNNPIVTLSGSLLFPTTDCDRAPPGGQEVTLTNSTNQPFAYTAKFVAGTWYTLVDSSSGNLAANNIAKIVVNPKMVAPGPGVFPGSAPYADSLLITVGTTPSTTFAVPISWTLNGAVLSLPLGAGPNTDSQGRFYVADGTSGFALAMVNSGTATATVSVAVQPSGTFLLQPGSPIAVAPGVPALPELMGAASTPACPTTSAGTATFVISAGSGPVCQFFAAPSVNVRSCSTTYLGGGGPPPPPADAGADASGEDAGSDAADAGSDSGGSNVPDAGSDAADATESTNDVADVASAPPTACTAAPCAASGPNSVQCSGSNGSLCTPTEALIVARDISKGNLANGQLTNASCYACLIAATCIDDNVGDTGNECGDLAGTVGSGARAAEAKTDACLNTLSCILPPTTAASCALEPSDGISNCYCGSAFPTIAECNGATGSTVNGVCVGVEIDGFGETATTAPSTILGKIAAKASGSGMANAILKCAGTNTTTPACPQCFH